MIVNASRPIRDFIIILKFNKYLASGPLPDEQDRGVAAAMASVGLDSYNLIKYIHFGPAARTQRINKTLPTISSNSPVPEEFKEI